MIYQALRIEGSKWLKEARAAARTVSGGGRVTPAAVVPSKLLTVPESTAAMFITCKWTWISTMLLVRRC